jgi:hypothetical protein
VAGRLGWMDGVLKRIGRDRVSCHAYYVLDYTPNFTG